MDWSSLFGITLSPWELVVRGSAMYLFLFLLFRIVVRRRVGAIGMADLLVLVIIADASQNAMAGEYRTITEGAILVATIVAWDMLIDWATYRWETLERLLQPPPLLLISDGKLLRRNLRKEFITDNELASKLREHGITDAREVQKAYMEPDGEISVISRAKKASSS